MYDLFYCFTFVSKYYKTPNSNTLSFNYPSIKPLPRVEATVINQPVYISSKDIKTVLAILLDYTK